MQPLIAAKVQSQALSSAPPEDAAPPGGSPQPAAAAEPRAFAALEARLHLLETSMAADSLAASSAPAPAKRFVINELTRCLHVVGICSPELPWEAWITLSCSWRFGLRRHTLLAEAPALPFKHAMCEKCFPGARRPEPCGSVPGSPLTPPSSSSSSTSSEATEAERAAATSDWFQ